MKKFSLFLMSCLLATSMYFFAGCSKNTSTPGSSNANANVPDPDGTITVSARDASNGKTDIWGNLYIDAGDNFVGMYISTAGQVHGLGNVTKIPTSGWSTTNAVQPGYGYVGYVGGVFLRIYVDSWITAAGTDGIIGAMVKYQEPFNGDAKDIGLPKSITMTDNGSGGGYYGYYVSIPINAVSGVYIKNPPAGYYGGGFQFNTSTGQASLTIQYQSNTAPPAKTTITVSASGLPDEQIEVDTPQ